MRFVAEIYAQVKIQSLFDDDISEYIYYMNFYGLFQNR